MAVVDFEVITDRPLLACQQDGVITLLVGVNYIVGWWLAWGALLVEMIGMG